MSAAHQLELGAVSSPKRKKEPASRFVCKCGHERTSHANRMHSGMCAICGTECKRFRPKSKPPVEQPAHLAPPNGAIILERDDTKNAKVMGWAIVKPCGPVGIEAFNGLLTLDGLHAIIYLAQLKTKSPNVGFFGGADKTPGFKLKQRFAWLSAYKASCRERAASAIAQLGVDVALRGRPSAIVITRVSPGKLDADNMRGAMKFVVDGVAEALGFNDAELEDSDARAGGTIGIRYAQEKCPQKVCGVRIQLTWEV